MDKVILIKYGELSTKKGNLNFFIKNVNIITAYTIDETIVIIRFM